MVVALGKEHQPVFHGFVLVLEHVLVVVHVLGIHSTVVSVVRCAIMITTNTC